MSEWTADSNEALTLSFVRASEDKEMLSPNESYEEFHPTFTYPIYGDDQTLYGYRDPIIDLRFASGSLKQYVNLKHAGKLASSSANTVDDPVRTLKEFIPEDILEDEEAFRAQVEEDAVSFKPIGTLIHSYTRHSGTGKGKGKETALVEPDSDEALVFEAYHATFDTPGFKEYHARMQIFILLYIEAGSYIDVDQSWDFAVLYEKRKRKSGLATYHFIGYTSLYNFYYFPEKTRLRLSQFVIIPPYQRQGHGSALYNAVYQYIVQQPQIAELTVEDPAEAFEDLRDRNDLKLLLGNAKFVEEAYGAAVASSGGGRVGGVGKSGKSGRGGNTSVGLKGKMGPPTDKAWAEKWRLELKLAGRQYQRLIEMLLLLRLSPSDKKAQRAYRLQVKERIYRFNYEALAQVEDKEERQEKLELTFQGVMEDYGRILSMIRSV